MDRLAQYGSDSDDSDLGEASGAATAQLGGESSGPPRSTELLAVAIDSTPAFA